MPVGIGLDFGTTNSAVALARDAAAPAALTFGAEAGIGDTWRSILYFEPGVPAVTGPTAIARYLAAGEKGRLVQSLKSFLASRLFTSTSVFGRSYTVEDLVAILLRDLREEAERQIGPIEGTVVVGRPVHFSSADTEDDNAFAVARFEKALARAGFGPVRFEYEPVAAARFYEETLDHDELILIGDFGGGTSDFSLLRVGPTSRRESDASGRILANDGVAVAGDAFDGRIVRNLVSPALGRDTAYRSLDKMLPMPVWVYSELERWHYLSFLKSPRTLEMLRSIEARSETPGRIAALLHLIEEDLGFYLHQAVQATKAALSSSSEARFLFEDFEIRVDSGVRRGDFERWIAGDLAKIRGCIDRVMAAAGVPDSGIDHVFLTGGSSLVPSVRGLFERRFGNARISTGSEFTSVAKGLASTARDLAGNK